MAKKKKDKKEHENYKGLFIALFLLVLLAAVVIYIRIPKYKHYEYNGFEFTKSGDMWFTEVQKFRTNQIYIIELRYDPKSLEDIPVYGNPKNFVKMLDPYEEKAAYITFDPLSKNLSYTALVAADLSTNLKKVMDIQLLPACTRNETIACSELPVIDCTNKENMVLMLKEGSYAKIIMNENCLILEGSGNELVKAANKLLLIWYNIMS